MVSLQILAWGLRNMKTFNLLAVSSPSLIIECGGESIETPIITNIHENPNFSINIFLMHVVSTLIGQKGIGEIICKKCTLRVYLQSVQ